MQSAITSLLPVLHIASWLSRATENSLKTGVQELGLINS